MADFLYPDFFGDGLPLVFGVAGNIDHPLFFASRMWISYAYSIRKASWLTSYPVIFYAFNNMCMGFLLCSANKITLVTSPNTVGHHNVLPVSFLTHGHLYQLLALHGLIVAGNVHHPHTVQSGVIHRSGENLLGVVEDLGGFRTVA